MKKTTRFIFLVINLILGLTFVLPLWKINLLAPQYPEGLEMKIWINRLSGNLPTINNLNHYIGMKLITPDSIAELKLMPYILGFIILFGLLIVILNKKFLLIIWFGILSLAGISGLTDFYSWLYDYGHNLNPHAPIKIPGMSYQPPLIGTKQLLNFTATSLPAPGGLILIIAGISVFILLVFEIKKTKTLDPKKPLIGFLSTLFLISCIPQPEPINFGTDACFTCKMNIVDNKYGGEIVTSKGKVFKFDSVGCLVDFFLSKADKQKDLIFVIDLANPGKFLEAKKGLFLYSEKLTSPMRPNLAGFENMTEIEKFKPAYPGKVLNWEQVLNFNNKDK